MFIGGDSGEGKSIGSLRLQEMLLEIQGLDLHQYMNDINVYTPIEYPKKVDRLLFEKSLKKVNIICMHEAREIVKAKKWHTFVNQAIGDVNAMSRSIKRLCIMIISQFIRDISTDIRYTLNYYCIIRRPKGKKPRLYINVMWKDDRDLEKPKLRRRKLSGYIKLPNGTIRRYIPQYLELSKPPKEIIDEFEKQDYEAKATILRRKVNKIIKELEVDMEVGNKKIESMVKFYTENTESLQQIGKKRGKKWQLKPQVRDMHDLTQDEFKDFSKQLNTKLNEMGVINEKHEEEGT